MLDCHADIAGIVGIVGKLNIMSAEIMDRKAI